MNPLVSVIILNWNGKEILQECVFSVLKTLYKPIEVIVVDNNSTDGSEKTVEGIPEVRLIRNGKNLGYAAGNNIGFKNAAGKYCVTLNNDMIVDPNWLDEPVRHMEADNLLAAVCCRQMNYFSPKVIDSLYHYPDIGLQFQRMGRNEIYDDHESYKSPGYVIAANGGSAMYRASVLQQLCGFEESFFAYYDEIDLCLKLFLNGWKCLYSPTSVVYHKDGASFAKVEKQRHYYIERNRIWLIYRYFPLAMILRNMPRIARQEYWSIKYFFINKRLPMVYFASRYSGLLGMWKFRGIRRRNVRKFKIQKIEFNMLLVHKINFLEPDVPTAPPLPENGDIAPTPRFSINKWFYHIVYKFKRFSFIHVFFPPSIRRKLGAALFRRAYMQPQSSTTLSGPRGNFEYGINVIGYLRGELGIGEAARATLRACKAAGIPTAAIDFTKGISSRLGEKIPASFKNDPEFGVTLLLLNAAQIPHAVADHESALQGRYTIAFWNWELPELPDSWLECTCFLNEVWAPSRFCATAFSRKLKIPVTLIPYAIDVELPSGIGRRELGVPDDGFMFLYMFDALSTPERKNPMAAVEAYIRAKPSFGRKTYFVLKIINGEKETDVRSRLQSAMDRDPSIIAVNRYFLRPELNALFNAADCYISLHRSEGFGLTLAESMFLGKPVIATGWSSNMDFMTPLNSIPVPYRLIQLERDYIHYPRGQWWADPDIDAAAAAMVRVVNDPDYARSLGARAASDIREKYSPAAVGKIIRERLDAVMKHKTG